MKCGTPVVCSNTGSIMEIVKNTALTCDAFDIKSFVKNILNLLDDNNLYLKIKNDALDRSKIFSLSSYHDKLIDIYKKELSNKK